jgi:hypothetical protein
MTCLDMQNLSPNPDTMLVSIIRQAEKRHAVYERVEKSDRERLQKTTQSRVDELEWELCLRRFFEYLDSRSTGARSDHSHSSKSEFPEYSEFNSSQRRTSMPALLGVRRSVPDRTSSYRSFRQGGSTETLHGGQHRLVENSQPYNAPSYNEIYTRTRRNSTASTHSTTSNTSGSSRTNSWTGPYDQPMSSVTDVGFLRSPNFGPGAQWQEVPIYSEHGGGSVSQPQALLGSRDTPIGRAWNDIVSTTPYLPPGEARAYIRGRLAGLDPISTAQIKRSLSMDNMSLASSPFAPSPPYLASQQIAEVDGQSCNSSEPVTHSKLSPTTGVSERQVEPQQLSRAVSAPSPNVSELKPSRSGQLRPVGGTARPKSARRLSRKRLSGMRIEHTRSLSTIVERPSSVRSKASKAESHISRKSIFNQKKEKLPSVPDTLQLQCESRSPSPSESVKSAGSSTLRGSTPDKSRIAELDDLTEESPSTSQRRDSAQPDLRSTLSEQRKYQNLKTATTKSKRCDLKAATSKSLPPTPADLPEPNRIRRMASLLGFKKSRKHNVVLPPSISTPQLANAMRSAETLRKSSLDCLRRNGSKSTLCLVAIQEGPEQPFQVWLSALPYIEGRAATPITKV